MEATGPGPFCFITMYLEKLEIQGFKSFANKNKLVFSGLIEGGKRGLTAVVGPNGSGKSNVADAIRWALGEQSLKTLRGKKSEDVIFSGSDQKHQLSLAEVSLHLNNERKGAKKGGDEGAAVESESDLDRLLKDCSEIVITRRIYRSGESEYLLNNSRARLSDIQMLLAKANFGQKTYSVIGQGMVENFLSTSAAERKDFFDEATGVKQFQIKRDAALNKLEGSYENLQQVEMLLTEIKPRLRSLTRQVERLNRRSQLESELKSWQLEYYGRSWQEINRRLEEANESYLRQEKTKIDKEKKYDRLESELDKLKTTDNSLAISRLQPQLQALYNSRNQLLKELAKTQAELELDWEAKGQFDISWLSGKEVELKRSLETVVKELAAAEKLSASPQAEALAKDMAALDQSLAKLRQELERASQEISVSSRQDNARLEMKSVVEDFLNRLESIAQLEDVGEIKTELSRARQEFQDKIKVFLAAEDAEKLEKIKDIQAEIISLSEKKQSLAEQLSQYRLESSAQSERLNLKRQEKAKLEAELEGISAKIKQQSLPEAGSKAKDTKEALDAKLAQIDKQALSLEKELADLDDAKDKEKEQIFSCQRQLQALQEELNSTNTELSELKIRSAREETRLEDLEKNIRNDQLDLNEVTAYSPQKEDFDPERAQRKIQDCKNQLDQIGGIDPETEKEYQETKERYDFLSHQLNDLNGAIKSLEEVIYELDLSIKSRFDREFKVISEKFNEYFQILFNGGQAKISKVMIADLEKEEEEKNISAGAGENAGLSPQEAAQKKEVDDKLKKIRFLKKHNAVGLAGIEIQATPPGKKIQAVTMLSGGERALTAIALICAIISANPSPFVVLDEVDAALDESNSERLAQILDDLSDRTQFIVITHNRASMRKASILYGVTMGADGVSQLLSVKLDDLKK